MLSLKRPAVQVCIIRVVSSNLLFLCRFKTIFTIEYTPSLLDTDPENSTMTAVSLWWPWDQTTFSFKKKIILILNTAYVYSATECNVLSLSVLLSTGRFLSHDKLGSYPMIQWISTSPLQRKNWSGRPVPPPGPTTPLSMDHSDGAVIDTRLRMKGFLVLLNCYPRRCKYLSLFNLKFQTVFGFLYLCLWF